MSSSENYVGCSVIVEHEREKDAFLLVSQTKGYRQGLYDLPGGRLDPAESLENCAVRETIEETGLHVVLRGLVTVCHRLTPTGNNHIGFKFAAESYKGVVTPSVKHPIVRFVPFEEIIEMEATGLLRENGIVESIESCRAGRLLPPDTILELIALR